MKKNRLLLLFIMAMPFAVAAQDLDQLFKGSASDAKYLVEGYASPAMKAFGYGLNNGWVNTAKPHKIAGFDLTISANPVFVPTSDQLFMVDNAKLTNLNMETDVNGKPVAPLTGKGNMATLFGPDNESTFRLRDQPTVTVKTPGGVGLNFLPVPVAHLGFGLPKGFDIKFRFIPTLSFGDGSAKGKVGLWGIGVMHDFKQWIPGIKQLPFDLSAFVGYTKLSLTMPIEESNVTNGKGEFSSAATTVQVIISKKLSVLTPYVAVGFNAATTKLAIKGRYDFEGTVVNDPFALSVASNGPRLTGGLRLKFGPIAFHGDYTLAKYKSASVGFGINIR